MHLHFVKNVCVLLFELCFSHTKPVNMQGICQHSRQATVHQASYSPYTDTDCRRLPPHPPPSDSYPPRIYKSEWVSEWKQCVEATFWRVCVSVVDAHSAPQSSHDSSIWLVCPPHPNPQWHRYDIIATPDPKPDLIPACQGERGRGGKRRKRREERQQEERFCTIFRLCRNIWSRLVPTCCKAKDETAW